MDSVTLGWETVVGNELAYGRGDRLCRDLLAIMKTLAFIVNELGICWRVLRRMMWSDLMFKMVNSALPVENHLKGCKEGNGGDELGVHCNIPGRDDCDLD